jgi:hypothetical protein
VSGAGFELPANGGHGGTVKYRKMKLKGHRRNTKSGCKGDSVSSGLNIDRLIHDYSGVDYDIVWDVVENKIPSLREDILAILKKEYALCGKQPE